MGRKPINEIGNKYGYLTIISSAGKDNHGLALWKCKCKCGNETIVRGSKLRAGETKSCGCYWKEKRKESIKIKDLTGQRFGKLVVLKQVGFITEKDGKRRSNWLCQCDCGNTCEVRQNRLTFGFTKSCGCLSSYGNMIIEKWLKEHFYKYKKEYSFKNFICTKYPYRFDFAILDDNNKLLGLIEYQGNIHYKYQKNGWNNKEAFINRIKHDQEKFDYCKENNIKLYYINYLEDIEQRLEEITRELYSE